MDGHGERDLASALESASSKINIALAAIRAIETLKHNLKCTDSESLIASAARNVDNARWLIAGVYEQEAGDKDTQP